MTIRAKYILPGPLPIWDRGTFLRPMTAEETRDFVAEFRQVRDDYGRVVQEYRQLSERMATMEKAHNVYVNLLYSAIVDLLDARTNYEKRQARKNARQIVSTNEPPLLDDEW